jgi:hypothetical protein
MDDSAKLDILSDYLRFTYAQDVNGLRKKITDIASNGALEFVTITGDSYEGTSHQGQLTLAPLIYLGAALAILRELDPTAIPEPPVRGALTDFRTQIVGT